MSKENDSINDRLDKISEAIVFLTEKVLLVEQRMNKEESLRKTPRVSIDVPPRPNYARPEISDKTPKDWTEDPAKRETRFVSGSGAKFYIKKEKQQGAAGGKSLEVEIGLKWLGKIGILALVIGVAFFLKYAFENDWIGETGRVVMGILSGMALIYLGDYLRQKYAGYAATLTGGGIAVLYLSIYSSFAYYQLLEQLPAFAAMAIITAIGAFLAIRYEQINLAVLAILGGFLTPVLLSTGTNNQIGLFSYITILNFGILAVSFYRNWQKLNLLGFLATLFLYLGWSAQYYQPKDLFLTEAFLILWFIIYSVATVSHNVLSKKKTDVSDLSLIVLNGLVYFGISYFLLAREYGDYLGFFTVLMAAVYFIFAYVSYQTNPEDKELALFFPGLAIFFLTIAAPIQFDGFWVTISWATEAAILVAGGFYLKSYAMRFFAWMLLGVVVIRLLFIDNHEIVRGTAYTMIFNMRFLTFIIGIISFSAVYYLYSKYESLIKNEEIKSKVAALFLLNFLLLWNLSAEVTAFYENQAVSKYKNLSYPQCDRWDYGVNGKYAENAYCVRQMDEYFAAQNEIVKNIRDMQGTKNASLTILWAFYAISLLVFGIFSKNRLLRLMGIGLFGIVIIKFFLYDLWNMGGVWRIISTITLGVMLLAASFVYNKYREKIKEII